MTQARPPSVPASAQPPRPEVGRRLQPYGAVLVPLVLAGLLPWWAVALLCLVFGLGVRVPAWQDARVLVSLLIAGLATLPELAALRGSGNGEALLDMGGRYLVLLVALGLSGYGLAELEGGRRRGLVALLCAGLCAPQPLLLPALVGGALLRPGTDDRLGRRRARPAAERAAERRGWGLVLGAVLALTLLALALPRSGAPTVAGPVAAGRPPAIASAQPPQPSAVPLTETARRRPASTSGAGGLPQPPAELLLLAGALTFAALGALLWGRRQVRGARVPPTLTELLMAGGLLLTLALLLVFSLGGRRGAAGDSGAVLPSAPTGGAASSVLPPEQVGASSGFSVLLWALLALQVLLAVALIWVLWRHRPVPEKLVPEAETGDTQVPALPDAVPATHRVRAAYRQAEGALAAAGRGRAPAEAPGAYAARLGAAHPELAAPLDLLTRLYGPVRYGGRVSEAEAEGAEAAAAEIAGRAARLPPLPDPSTPPEDLL